MGSVVVEFGFSSSACRCHCWSTKSETPATPGKEQKRRAMILIASDATFIDDFGSICG